jgi:hypothetical protein
MAIHRTRAAAAAARLAAGQRNSSVELGEGCVGRRGGLVQAKVTRLSRWPPCRKDSREVALKDKLERGPCHDGLLPSLG